MDKPLGSQEVEASRMYKQSAHEGGKVVSPTHRPPLPIRKYPWYSFLLEAESNPEPLCGRKDYVNEISHRESNPHLPGCSAGPQPIEPPSASKLMNGFSIISLKSTTSQNSAIWNWRVSFATSGRGTGRHSWEYCVKCHARCRGREYEVILLLVCLDVTQCRLAQVYWCCGRTHNLHL